MRYSAPVRPRGGSWAGPGAAGQSARGSHPTRDTRRSAALFLSSSPPPLHMRSLDSLAGKKSQRKQEYALPWPGFQSWRDARSRLEHFEEAFKDKIFWAPFNDSVTNDGPMSLNAY